MKNIAEILKNLPKGIKLYSPYYGEVKLERVIDDEKEPYPIITIPDENDIIEAEFDRYGRMESDIHAKCVLFPSKEHQSWDNWLEAIVKKCMKRTEFLNQRILRMAEKLSTDPQTLKMLVYSNYGADMTAPEEKMKFMEYEYEKEKEKENK